ncbi:MAG: ATP-dependent 6-phosphofructokinase, partial [Oscillospiraceae bacterium]|nr:ATP-dependent 6-phosphofructokinase [Oscillospiraceae bacterium]
MGNSYDTAIKRIAVLTSGGDAPGMNAAIRAVVRSGIYFGLEVVGIERGYNGMLSDEDEVRIMALRDVSDIISAGGTILFSARSRAYNSPEGVQKAAEFCARHRIGGVVVIGGDGSFRGAHDLSQAGVPCVGVPGTIDNDIASSYYTIGYDTALNTAMRMIDNIRDTTESHDRCSVVEVMGARSGYLALNTGLACGASAILVPEHCPDGRVDIDQIINRIRINKAQGKRHFIVVVAEGVGIPVGETLSTMQHKRHFADVLAETIESKTGIESRSSILGHVQRGGSPTVRDRVVATEMGCHAVNLMRQEAGNRVVVMDREGIITDLDITAALSMKKPFPSHLL